MSNIDADLSPDGNQITIDDYRAAMDRAAKAERRAEQADRTSAMAIAGIPTGTAPGAAFVEKYTGKLDDVEAIRAAAVEWGLWKPEGSDANPATPSTPADQAQVDADRAALQNAGAALNPGDQPPSRHPAEEGLDRFYQRVQTEGARREDAFPEIFDRLVDAAVKGDERVLVQDKRKS